MNSNPIKHDERCQGKKDCYFLGHHNGRKQKRRSGREKPEGRGAGRGDLDG